jgi:hypothetical protein
MSDVADTMKEAVESAGGSSWNGVIAVLVAVSAAFMAVCNVKDGNVVQAMAQVQAKSVDTWSYFQAKSTKQVIAQAMGDQVALRLETEANLTPQARQILAAKVESYRAEAQRYETEKATIKAEAEGYQKEYDRLNTHDDQFDMSEAALTLALALYAVTILTRKRWLFVMAIVFSCFGFVMGVSGFAGWNLHPDWLARFLG